APPIVSVEDSPPIKKRQLPDRSAMPSYAPVEVDTGAASTSTFGLNITPISDTRSTSAPATPYSPSSIDETIEAMARPWKLLYPPACPTTCVPPSCIDPQLYYPSDEDCISPAPTISDSDSVRGVPVA
ncbi:hypothetical protein H0H92_000592, partial [Tricholoma furcatifolium]